LLNRNLIFDYATQYFRLHPALAANDVVLTESDFEDFRKFISTKEYDYLTKSEQSLDELVKNSEEEKYYDDLSPGIAALRSKLAHNKQEDVLRNKEEIIALLAEEIASRYFFQSGRIRRALTSDAEVKRAVQLLSDPVQYAGILNGAIEADAGNPGLLKR
jgi:carboxyl-terminal processing protease